jgi:hypothetical protein
MDNWPLRTRHGRGPRHSVSGVLRARPFPMVAIVIYSTRFRQPAQGLSGLNPKEMTAAQAFNALCIILDFSTLGIGHGGRVGKMRA